MERQVRHAGWLGSLFTRPIGSWNWYVHPTTDGYLFLPLKDATPQLHQEGCNHKFIICGCSAMLAIAVHEYLLLMAIFGRSGGSDKERASMKGQNSAGDDRHETNSVSMNTQLWGVLYIPLPRQGTGTHTCVTPHTRQRRRRGRGPETW